MARELCRIFSYNCAYREGYHMTLLDASLEWIAASVAGIVFVAVLLALHVASVRRDRQSTRRRLEDDDLRTRGA